MRRAFAAVVLLLLAGSSHAGVQERVESVSGSSATLSVGARDGVAVGMTGKVTQSLSAGDKARTIPIASFRVTRVQERTSTVTLTEVGQGFRVETGNEVTFDKPVSARKAEPAAPTRPAPQTREASPNADAPEASRANLELAFWSSVKDSADPVEIQAYLDKYPNGTFTVLAQARLKKLGPQPAAPPPASRDAAAARQDAAREPVALPEPIGSGTAINGFAVQVGAFKDRATAEDVVRSLKNRGLPAYTVAPAGSGLFTVRIGVYRDRADADAVQARLRDDRFRPVVLKQ